jgi:hypothetical protein
MMVWDVHVESINVETHTGYLCRHNRTGTLMSIVKKSIYVDILVNNIDLRNLIKATLCTYVNINAWSICGHYNL